MGYLVIRRLIKNKHKTYFRKYKKAVSDSTSSALINKICKPCPFYEDDCDFAEQKEKALPCGGFILLGHMIEEKIVRIEEITEEANGCL